ncbi:hypothetical protein Q9Q95_13290 [Sphingomonas sp. DG1-23]|jgi:hypothetical protein|nr:hypothetical protein [Sphingomonas sp. DG1-23]
MSSVINGIAALAATLVSGLLTLGVFGIAIWLGMRIRGRTNRQWAGWAAGLPVGALLLAGAVPVYDALETVKCRPYKDYQACLNGEGEVEDEEWRAR